MPTTTLWRGSRFPPLTCVRVLCTAVMFPIIGAMMALTHVPMWRNYYVLTPRVSPLRAVVLMLFESFLGLTILSLWKVWSTDPGSVPPEWSRHVAKANNLPYKYPYCKRTEEFKPPRSAYDSVTRRVVLNFDHFCPWVASAVGFYNRKFFILFCVWGGASCILAAVALFPFAFTGLTASNASNASSPASEQRKKVLEEMMTQTGRTAGGEWDTDYVNSTKTWSIMACIFDVTFGIALVSFSIAHVYMAAYNQGTGSEVLGPGMRNPFDLGLEKNLQSVFGWRRAFWFLPIHVCEGRCESPLRGNGVVWEVREGGGVAEANRRRDARLFSRDDEERQGEGDDNRVENLESQQKDVDGGDAEDESVAMLRKVGGAKEGQGETTTTTIEFDERRYVGLTGSRAYDESMIIACFKPCESS